MMLFNVFDSSIVNGTAGTGVRLAMLAAAMGVMIAPSLGAENTRLYLVAGTQTDEGRVPVYLYSVDEATGGPVKQEAKIADGLNAVLVDYQSRSLVILSPELNPAVATFIDMDRPEKPTVRSISYPEGLHPSDIYLLNGPQKAGVAFALGRMQDQGVGWIPFSQLFFVSKDSDKPTMTPLGDVKYLRTSGFGGGPQGEGTTLIELEGDPLSLTLDGTARFGIGIPRPPYMTAATGKLKLILNDDARAIVESDRDPLIIDAYSKAENKWRRIPIPFSGTLRAFGPWVAGIETRDMHFPKPPGGTLHVDGKSPRAVSPGAEKRRSEKILPSGYDPSKRGELSTVQDFFDDAAVAGIVFPGELFALNVDTGVTVRISTGSGDSEVLLVAGDVIYYRIDDALYRADIVGSSLTNSVKLVEGPEIVQSHWAFLN